jgi:serine/threonine protein kinase
LATIAGTAAFMAPEQVSEYWGPIGPVTDVYGLGAVLFALLTSHPPYSAKRVADALSGVVSRAPVRQSPVLPGPPAALVTICRRCLCTAPAERFQSADELLAALESIRSFDHRT